MSDPVSDTLRLWRRTPFQWGTSDCIMSAADYVLLVRGVDPVPEWRGTYSTEVEAEFVIADAGSVAALLDGYDGLVRSETPERGDLVVIWTGAEELVGLCTGQSAAFRLRHGVKEIDMRFLKVVGSWKV